MLSHDKIYPMSNVLLCANEPILAEGLRRILENVPGLDLVGCCPRLEDLREQIEALQPDILLVDLTADVTFAVLSGLREAVSTSTDRPLGTRDLDRTGVTINEPRCSRHPAPEHFRWTR